MMVLVVLLFLFVVAPALWLLVGEVLGRCGW